MQEKTQIIQLNEGLSPQDLNLKFVRNRLKKNELYSIDGVPVPSYDSDKLEFLTEYLKPALTLEAYLKAWEDPKKRKFKHIVGSGRRIAEDLADHFIEEMPPAEYNNRFFQCGEAFMTIGENTVHRTFYFSDKTWSVYLGLFFKGDITEGIREQ